ncbi:transcription termination factor 2 isoform X2 [Eurytemora carolleeae]|uniref:transcription termination factor 2 isoform X2 n=1 Tax=Eurytemora carolleeae TaxID=1294199 RepID=UPI000C7838A0|nr:transcription termination factor 2 isoform X2 [Eurytemora carolleeae]|eukprot:XP_023338911.1 transcription termination factor 2-like isoform X2 [Eurytemora affinis]
MKQNFHQMTSEDIARLYASDAAQNNLYGGRMTNNRQREVKSVIHDAMVKMHKSLESMPAEGDMEEQPKSLESSITLFPHQLQALAWLTWREHQSTPGGILADDMSLGKTLTMISLILKHKEVEEVNEEKDSSWKTKGMGNLVKTRTTLIVCPASLMGQWENEIKNKVKSGILCVLVYHGAGARKSSAREMSRYDVIITTYGVILSEVKAELGDAFKEPKKVKKGKILSLAFERIILDEAHTIRNPKSLQSQAVCKLKAARRWCVTGTPIQNKELDMYSLIRFLRCAPFDEYMVWKRWVENKSVQSTERMNTLIKSLLLRRTKEETRRPTQLGNPRQGSRSPTQISESASWGAQEEDQDQKSNLTGKSLVNLPDKNMILHEITLSEQEKEVYSEVEKFAKGAMAKFLDQKGDEEERREMGLGGGGGGAKYRPVGGVDEFAFQPFGSKGSDDGSVKAHHLLTLLLRMRQICCHPNLIKGMLDQETREHEGIEDNGEDLDLISQLECMNLTKDREEDTTKILEMSNPVFSPDCASSKIDTVVTELKKLKMKADEEGIIEKAVVISQWTAMLDIVKVHIKEQGLKYTEITGQVAISSRGEIVESFNKDKFGPQIMLLSLAAGGVGLNLVGANHLFLLDPHWNPQLESQACDRIYRVGQKREVKIHKFMVKDTVEVRILKLQENKLKLAEDMLSGAKKRGANKLTLDDLKSLFNVE